MNVIKDELVNTAQLVQASINTAILAMSKPLLGGGGGGDYQEIQSQYDLTPLYLIGGVAAASITSYYVFIK